MATPSAPALRTELNNMICDKRGEKASSMHNPKIEEAAAKYLDGIGPDAYWRRGDMVRHMVAFAEDQIASKNYGLGAAPVAGQHKNASGDNHAANVPAPVGKTPNEASNSIRERFERLQRYAKHFVKHVWHSYAGDSHVALDKDGDWLKRDDVLALADELDREWVHTQHLLRRWLLVTESLTSLTKSAHRYLANGSNRNQFEAIKNRAANVLGIELDAKQPPDDAVTDEQVTEFSLACHSPETRLAILRKWCSGCGGPKPCNCERDE